MVYGDFRTVKQKLQNDRFDCLLCLNILHLVRDPVELLCVFNDVLAFKSIVIIQTPNMLCGPVIWRRFRDATQRKFRTVPRSIERTRGLTNAHFIFPGRVRYWCRSAGLKAGPTIAILHRRVEALRMLDRGWTPGFMKLLLAPRLVTTAQKT